ncbi:MAG: DUF2796 domain-containing protein [Rhizobiaceae bacterium]|nr:DUF2796 domain-containing protein [Rhizobiaceae bacterium]
MKISRKVSIVLAAASALAFGPTSLQASERNLDAHEHGVSTLRLAQEGKVLQFELEAPGDDIVGFEHAAENDAQKSAVTNALSQLQKPETLFVLPDDANCTASDQHAEFETEEDHAEFHVTWTMTCENPASATSLAIQFFGIFQRAEEIEVEAIGNAGQAAIEVEKDQTSVDLSQAIGG